MTRIMVVDDDPLIRQLLSYQLGTAGYQVCTAHNGQVALERLIQDHPDIVLLDVVMPGMSGWDVCHQIRICSPIPVIMLTAKAADHDVITGLESGADDYIAKPFSLPQLLARIEAVLRRNRSFVPWHAHPAHNGSGGRVSFANQGMASPTCTVALSSAPLSATAPILSPAPARVVAPSPTLGTSRRLAIGQRFALARYQRGLSLEQVEAACGISQHSLRAIEQEQLDDIPKAELPMLLKQYSTFLGLDLRSLLSRSQPVAAPPLMPIYLVIFVMIMLILMILITMPPF